VQVLSKGPERFEESAARRQFAADGLIAWIEQIEHGMGKESQQGQTGQQRGQMLFAVAVVVLEMIALGLQSLSQR